MSGDLNIALILKLVDQVTAPARLVKKALGDVGRQTEALGRSGNQWANQQLAANQARKAALRGEAMGVAAVGYMLANALKPAIQFEKSMAGVSKVVDFESPEGLSKLSSEILKLTSSGGLPMAAEGVAEIIEAAGKAGLIDSALPDDQKIRELINFATAAAKMGVAFDISAGQAGDAMAQWQAALGMSQQESIKFGDALNHVANNMNTTEAKLLNVIGYVGAVAKTAGLANNEIVALSGAILAAGASPERAATGLKNFTNALTKGENMTKRQSAVIRELNMDADELAQRMQVDAKGAIIDVLEALKELPKYKQGAAIGALFGEEAKGAITPLLLNLDNLRKAFELVDDPANYAGAMLKEYAKQSATTDNALKLTMGFVKGLSITIGTFLLPELNELLSTVQPMIATATAWAQAHPELVTQIFRVVAGLLAFKIASIALRFTLFSLLTPFLYLIKGMSGLLIFLPRLAAGMLALLSPIKLVRGALIALRFALLATGIGAVIAGIAMAGVWIYNNWSGLKSFFTGFGTAFMAALGPARPLAEGVMNAVKSVWEWLGKLLAPLDASMGKWADWGKAAGTAVGAAIGSVIGFVGDLWTWLTDLPGVDWAELVPEFSWPQLPEFSWPKFPDISLPEMSWPELPDFKWPELPQVDWSKVKKATLSTFIAPFKLGAWVAEQFKGFEWPELPEIVLPKIEWLKFINLDGIKAAWGTVTDWLGTAASSLWDLIPEMPSFFGDEEIKDPETLLAAKRAADQLAKQFPQLDAAAKAVLAAAQEALRGVNALFQGASLHSDGAKLIQTLADGMLSKLDVIRAAARQIKKVMRSELPKSAQGALAIGASVSPEGKRDRGGPVRAGLPYLVGERGQEIFVPKVAGMILSNGALRAAVLASSIAAPIGLPSMAAAMPQIDLGQNESMIQGLDRRGPLQAGSQRSGPSIMNVGGITINATAGQDPAQIAQEVRRVLEQIERDRTGDLHDGGEF